VFASEITAVLQGVPGVVAVDLDRIVGITVELVTSADQGQTLGSKLPPAVTIWPPPIAARLATIDDENGAPLPAQIAYMNPNVPDVFVLTEVTP